MRSKKDLSKAAKALSVLGAAKGGRARSENMTPEERRDSARKAALARWSAKEEAIVVAVVGVPDQRKINNKHLPKETHTGEFRLLNNIPCSVLEGGTRVFAARPLRRMFGSKMTGTTHASRYVEEGALGLPPFLASKKVFSHVSKELLASLRHPITYLPKSGSGYALGYEATLIPEICQCILTANKKTDGGLGPRYAAMVDAAEMLIFGLAKVGINAMVDQYTGYQADRTSEEIEKFLESYLAKELLPYEPRFPRQFFMEIYRLHGWEYKPGLTQGPRYIGKLIVKYIYKKLPEGVWEKLDRANPSINGRRRVHVHRQLSKDIGLPHFDRLVTATTALLRVADDVPHFEGLLERAFPTQKKALPAKARRKVKQLSSGQTSLFDLLDPQK